MNSPKQHISVTGEQIKVGDSVSKKEDQFHLLVNEIKDYAIFMLDTSGRITSWNKGAYHIKGYTEDEILGKPISIFYTKEEIAKGEPEYNLKMANENGRFQNEGWRVRKDGTMFWANVVFTALYDNAGKIQAYSKVTSDITGKKQLLDEIEQMHESYASQMRHELDKIYKELSDYKYALDKSSIVAITDQKGIIKHVNDNFCKISKYSAEELIGKDHRIINSGYHPKSFIKDLWVTIANGKVWKGELKNRAKDGSTYWVDTTIVPFLNAENKPERYIAIRSDITLRKAAEELIEQLNRTLEIKVTERTRQLEEANKELEAFTYSVSHDLRAPLRIIDGYSAILSTELLTASPEENKRLLGIIMNNVQRMGKLIDELLNLSKLTRKALSIRETNMTELVKSVIEEQRELDNRQVEIRIANLHPAGSDPALIRQVWINLISNAVKYSRKQEHPLVEINSAAGDSFIIYTIKDNGIGFDMKYAHKLFDVFQRLHKMDEYEGTGIGLALVQRIVANHRGRVWAEAGEGKGATFYFSLPVTHNEHND